MPNQEDVSLWRRLIGKVGSTEAVAIAVGVSPGIIGRFDRGVIFNRPAFDTLLRIQKLFDKYGMEHPRNIETKSNPRKAHGLYGTREEYTIWAGILQRCNNPKTKGFKYYGGRGITVCKGFRKFPHFLEVLGPRPSTKHSVDRIDVNGNYACGRCRDCLENGIGESNCRWVTADVQANNKRNSKGRKS
jgi:hypothetical protein